MKTFLLIGLFLLLSVSSGLANEVNEFFAAVRNGNSQRVEEMLSKNKILVFTADKRGMTTFLVAVETRNLKMVSLLADSFSRLGNIAQPGNALHIAVSNDDEPMVRLLVRLSSEEDPALTKRLLNMRRRGDKEEINDRNTPLHLAALKCNFRVYNYLLEHGANPTLPNSKGKTPKQIISACPKPKPAKKQAAKPASSVPASKPKPVEEPLIFPIP